MSDDLLLAYAEIEALVREACTARGMTDAVAQSLAAAVVSAEASGNRAVGLSHLLDYLKALEHGRIDGQAAPQITSPAAALIKIDARRGIAQYGFDLAVDDLTARAKNFGIALLSQHNSYTTGELGYYPWRLAKAGLAAIAVTNGPALMTVPGGRKPVYCTNPLAFAAPRANGPPLLIDQSSSSTAFVNIRAAAAAGTRLAEGWAVDAQGQPTTDAGEALKGALLTFGGSRGANLALMVEVMAAGLSAANWSIDAPGFEAGVGSPGAGLVIIAIKPALLDPAFETRLDEQLRRLSGEGVHVPGRDKAARLDEASTTGLRVSRKLVETLRSPIADAAFAPERPTDIKL
ncbi:Ldh family oxidoreductase [Agrobacterium sp. a22-2]|uniref:Ldh family oxidoreductase n=1 Tax=Agrobacterium sp. a22-2 TaxID=2283840 RepID=UPI001445FD99|nr:Ldh family oxidoreductase [Agrobacterium sp. a22-2]NKN39692.1 Ldh family oxidoreductase [Agrobacterium sp. a22-2]